MSRSAIIRNALVPYKTGKYEEIDIKRLSKKDYSICTTKIPVGTLNMLHKIASSTGNTLTDIALDALRKYLSRFCMELKNKYTLKKKMQLSLPLNLFEEVENAVRGGCFLNRCDMIREALYNYLFEDKVLDRIVANLWSIIFLYRNYLFSLLGFPFNCFYFFNRFRKILGTV